MAETLFEWKLEAEALYPDTLPAHVLCEIVLNLEKSVLAVAQQQNPALKADDIVIALREVGEGSARLRFTSPAMVTALLAFTILTTAVKTHTYEALPRQALEGLDQIFKITKKRGYNSELRLREETRPSATIRVVDNVDIFNSRFLKGDTTIYGKLIRMGGEGSHASLQLRLDDDSTLTCQCNESLTRQLTREWKLYEIIGLTGNAYWNPNTLELVRFRAKDLLPYQDTDPVTAFDRLREATAGAYDDIENVDAYVKELRGT